MIESLLGPTDTYGPKSKVPHIIENKSKEGFSSLILNL